MPQMIIEPIMTAMTESPGMPRAIVVVREPPRVALDAVSDAATPSILPLPKVSLVFDADLARSQPSRPAISPPAPGMTPTIRPTIPEMTVGLAMRLYSDLVGHQRPSAEMG